jgi:hypothetical protein
MKINIFIKEKLRVASLMFTVLGFLAGAAGGIGLSGERTPATKLHAEAQQPAETQLILQENQPICYAVAGTSFIFAAILASVVMLTKTRMPTIC